MNNPLSAPVTSGAQDIDLSQYRSDGTGEECMNLISVAQSSTTFLRHLTHIFNTRGYAMTAFGHYVNFVNYPPKGYTEYWRHRRLVLPDDPQYLTIGNLYVYGYPSKKPFKSVARFGQHLVSIVLGDLDNCKCILCDGTGPAPKDAEYPADPSVPVLR
ncbi:hypothetical protein QM012_008550 [Aureobasidium pullulans]|uniref:Cryptic loci regulator 2 N-terminal domain-containing protein n=1 Tax=Aureobasidium pullulans TaxID=5580 RepID=A0ABR0TJT9_AURPU